MKKVLALILATLMALSCIACAAPKAEAPAAEAPAAEAPKAEAPKAEAPKAEAPKAETEAAAPAAEEDPFANGPEETLMLVHGNNLGTPNDNWANYFKELVEERSSGKITVNVYPNNEMGTERELTEGVQTGTYDIQVTGLISSLSFIPALATLNIPFLFNGMTAEQIDTALNTGDYAELMQDAYGNSQFRLLGGFMQAATFRNVTSNKEIRAIDDFKGLKIRIVENAYSLKQWKDVGAAPTPVTWAETYLSLQQGLVDAQENPFDNIFLGNIQDVQKYLVISEHLLNVNHMIMNKDRFESLPAAYAELVEACAAEARARAAKEMADSIEEYHQKLLDAGMTEIVLDEAVIAQLQDASAGTRELIKSEVGDELYNALISGVEAAK